MASFIVKIPDLVQNTTSSSIPHLEIITRRFFWQYHHDFFSVTVYIFRLSAMKPIIELQNKYYIVCTNLTLLSFKGTVSRNFLIHFRGLKIKLVNFFCIGADTKFFFESVSILYLFLSFLTPLANALELTHRYFHKAARKSLY
jgi:hypothetical protein